MARGIMYVESSASSPDRDQEYNTWYNEVHLKELWRSTDSSRHADCGRSTGRAIRRPLRIEGDDLQASCRT